MSSILAAFQPETCWLPAVVKDFYKVQYLWTSLACCTLSVKKDKSAT